MKNEERPYVAFHEAGHMVIVYWRGQSLHGRRIVLHTDRFGGSTLIHGHDISEWDLMVLLGGPVSEFIWWTTVWFKREAKGPDKPLLYSNEYSQPNSDSTRIRALVKGLRGKSDRRYLLQIQERCYEIIREPRMWRAVTTIAERLIADNEIGGEECERILGECQAQRHYDDPERYPIIQLPLGLKLPSA